MGDTITAEEIAEAQKIWGKGIVTIGKAFTDKGNYVKAAENHIDTLYAFEAGPVLSSPPRLLTPNFVPPGRPRSHTLLEATTNTRKTTVLPSTPGQMSVLKITRTISMEITRWPWGITFLPRRMAQR